MHCGSRGSREEDAERSLGLSLDQSFSTTSCVCIYDLRPLLSLLAVFTPSVTTRPINFSEYDRIQDASMTCVRLLVVGFLFYLFLHVSFFFPFLFFPFDILVELL